LFTLKNIPTSNAHSIPLTKFGDLLRVDLGIDSSFPNGRPIVGGSSANKLQADAPDILYSLILTKLVTPVADGVAYNDVNYLSSFPYAALPWASTNGHGKPTP
jgi:hypothetical protein